MGRVVRRLIAAFVAFVLASLAGSVAAAVALKPRLQPRGTHRDDDVELVAIFQPLEFTSTATPLRHLTVTTLFGGGTVDLRLATLEPTGGTLTVRAAFGGLRVLVPGTWRIDQHLAGVFGGVGDARERAWIDPGHAVLAIDGFALFGGVGVVSQAADVGPARPPTLVSDAPLPEDAPGANRGLVTDIEQVPPSPAEA